MRVRVRTPAAHTSRRTIDFSSGGSLDQSVSGSDRTNSFCHDMHMASNRLDDSRRYQVFVSSTYLDLQDERHAVTSTLLESDAFPAGMEIFPASDDDAWSLIKSVIDDSDYYLLVVGGKYGSIDPNDDISYTEKEFDYAIATAKPVMAFLHGQPDILTVEKSEKSEDKQQRLAQFRGKVQDTKHVKFWTTSEELAGKVAISFIKMTRQSPAIGWMRADKVATAQAIAELSAARDKIAELEADLNRLKSLPPEGSDEFSQGSDEMLLDLMVKATYKRAGNIGQVKTSARLRASMTWDEIFGAIAPVMLVEAEQSIVKEALDRGALRAIGATGIEALQAEAAQLDPTIDTSRSPLGYSGVVEPDSFGTVLIQLKALGLIEMSDRRRSVSDPGNYWRLTSRGDQLAIRIRAIKK